MNLNSLKSWALKRGGLILAAIGYIYYLILLITFLVFISYVLLIFVLIMLPLPIVGASHKDKIILIRRVKAMGWGLLVMAFILFPTFWNIPQQIYVRQNQQQYLLEPDAPEVKVLAADFLEQYEDLENMSIQEIGEAIREFVLEEIVWELDYVIYGMAAHQASASEAIRRGKDDCQGQACVMASILLNLDFDYVWVVEAPFHWWVIIRNQSLGKLKDGWEENVDALYHDGEIEFINRGGSRNLPEWTWADPVLIFNQEEILYPRGALWSSYSTGYYWWRQLVPLFCSLNIMVLIVGLLALAFFVTGWTSYQSSDKQKKGLSCLKVNKQLLLKKWSVLGGLLFGVMTLWTLLTLNRFLMDYSLIIAMIGFSTTISLAAEPKFWKSLHIRE